MIPFFDRFVDTREKRYHLLLVITLFTALIMVLPYLLLGLELIQLNDYNSLFELVKKPLIEWTYLSRIIVDAISITKLTFANVAACLMNNLSVLEVVMLVLLVFSVGILEKKRTTTITLALLVIEILLSCILAFCSLGASSLQSVISNIRIMGILILFINMVVAILLLYHLVKQLNSYYKALFYKSEEIKEHM